MTDDSEMTNMGIERRNLLLGGGAAMMAGLAVAGASPAAAAQTKTRSGAALGARLQGVQHFGLTVQNMERAFQFYTDVLGGTEVMRDGDFQGERIHIRCSPDRRSRRASGASIRAPWASPTCAAVRSGSTSASSSSTTS